MNKQTLLTAAAGVVVGGVLFNAIPARADLPTIDVATDTILGLLQTAVTGAINSMEQSVTNALTDISNPNSVSSLLRSGFTQNANYAKAQIGAQQQITDASNAANAVFGVVQKARFLGNRLRARSPCFSRRFPQLYGVNAAA
jgi:hypothetical protein